MQAMSSREASIHRHWSSGKRGPYRAIVAIPARNEAELIGRCLLAMEKQSVAGHMAVGVLVLVNGTTDATYREAQCLAEQLRSIDIHLVEASLPPGRCDAGTARQCAARVACTLPARADAALFLTDADSIVPPDWLQRYGELIWQQGYDAVAGGVDVLIDAGAAFPHALQERIRWEKAHETRLDAIEAWLDPCPHDCWPRHYQASGANIAIRCDLCRTLARSQWPACGEDKALIAAVEARDGRVRHDTSLRVATSGRLFGRARGGMADTIRQRIIDPASPCDPRLERAECAGFRADMRRQWRDVHTGGAGDSLIRGMAKALALSVDTVWRASGIRRFGASWQWLEARSPRLQRKALGPADLPWQVLQADALLDCLGVPCDQRPVPVEPVITHSLRHEADAVTAVQAGA